MIEVNEDLQAELDKGKDDPRVLVDLYELYPSDYIPGPTGYDPADAIETFAGQDITWNGIEYRRQVKSRGDIVVNFGEKTNSCSVNYSNIDRYLATLAENQQMEGLLKVIRIVSPDVEDDSLVRFSARCDKPGDIDKKQFSLTARQDFGNINQSLPPWEFSAVDPDGRVPSDPLFKGINFIAVGGTLTFGGSPGRSGSIVGAILGGVVGFLFGRRRAVPPTTVQWSSVDGTPYGQKRREVFGRVQLQLRPFAWADKGLFVSYLMEACNGPILAIENIKSRTEGFSDPFNLPGPIPAVVHLGDPGGTGTNMGNTNQADLGGGVYFSHLAYIEGASTGSSQEATDDPPVITALVFGRIIPTPDGAGEYVVDDWTDNPVHIARYILTHPDFVNIDPGFMQDDVNYLTSLHCDEPLIDESNDELIVLHQDDYPEAGTGITRFRSTGLLNPRAILYRNLGDTTIIPGLVDGPYEPWDPTDPVPPQIPGATPTYTRQKLLRKRYTFNAPITDEVRAVDFLYKTVFPTFKGYLRVNKFGKYEIRSEVPADATHIRSSTSVGATAIPVLNVVPWKAGPELLTGRILLGTGLTTSEVRTVSSADYSTSGNSVSLASSAGGGGITATASGANLSGGSTTVQASGTVTMGGTPAAGNTVTITIDGIANVYTLTSEDTTSTVAVMMTHLINATPRLRTYIKASWADGSPTVVTIKCLHGALNLSSALLKTHSGPIADPGSAPTIAAAASGSLDAGIYYVAYANLGGGGLTALTPVANATLTANQKINLSGLPALPAGVTERWFYVSEETGSQNLRFVEARTDASNFSINSLPEPGADLPPSVNTTAEELIRVAMSFATNSQDIYPAWPRSTVVVLNDIYLPTVLNGHKYQATSITTGLTAATEPTWPTTAGGTVVDNGVTWTEIGSTVLAQAGLTRANIVKDSFSFPGGSQQSSVNQIKGNFRSAKDDFALTPFKVNDRAHQLKVKKQYPLEMDLSAVDNWHQAERLANAALSKYREGDWFASFTASPQALVLEEGDVVCVSDDAGGLVNVPVRIEELRIKQNHEVAIRGRKYSTTMFSDDVGSHRIVIPSTLKLSKPRAISNLLVILQGDGDWFIQMTLNSANHPQEGIVDIYTLDGVTLKRTLRAIEARAVAVPLEDAGLVNPYEDLYDPTTKLPPIVTSTAYADKNNLIAPTGGTLAYVKSMLAIDHTGIRIDVTTDVPRDGSGNEENDNFTNVFGLIAADADPSSPGPTDIPFQIQWFAPDSPLDFEDKYIRVLNFADNVFEQSSNGMGSKFNVRAGETFSLVLSGAECRAYRNYKEGDTPLAVMNLSEDMFPLRIFAAASGGSNMYNFMIRGLTITTVYSVRQQEEDFGSAQTQIRMKIRQRAKLDSMTGIETDYTTP